MNGNAAEGTRRRLLEAALDVVTAHGLAAATSRRIATAAGTNLQAITYHFGTKDALVAEALVGGVRAWLEPVRAALDALADDPAAGLLRAVWRLQQVLDTAAPRMPAYVEALALAPRNDDVRARIRGLLAELRDSLATTLRTLQGAGVVADWVEPDAMAALVLATADGTALHLAVDPDGTEVDGVLGQLVPLLLSASTLGVPPPGGPGQEASGP